MSTTWLITGANRGIGFTLVKQLSADPSNLIIAACRSPEKADALKALGGSVHLVQLEVGDEDSIAKSVEPVRAILGDKGLDYLINNAGIAPHEDTTSFKINTATSLQIFKVNTLGPALVADAYIPFLEVPGRRGVIMNISSSLGAMDYGGKNTLAPTYCMSKAALNMLSAKQALEKPNLIAFAVCPGWVITDMGGSGAQLQPDDSASALLKLAKSVTKEHSGKFVQRNEANTGYDI
ncbi:unnamed protein product [Peniophora sp. CBMAI 1063]|nr:unnamed protein product [Peniophora sp. CBMAI 1063]